MCTPSLQWPKTQMVFSITWPQWTGYHWMLPCLLTSALLLKVSSTSRSLMGHPRLTHSWCPCQRCLRSLQEAACWESSSRLNGKVQVWSWHLQMLTGAASVQLPKDAWSSHLEWANRKTQRSPTLLEPSPPRTWTQSSTQTGRQIRACPRLRVSSHLILNRASWRPIIIQIYLGRVRAPPMNRILISMMSWPPQGSPPPKMPSKRPTKNCVNSTKTRRATASSSWRNTQRRRARTRQAILSPTSWTSPATMQPILIWMMAARDTVVNLASTLTACLTRDPRTQPRSPTSQHHNLKPWATSGTRTPCQPYPTTATSQTWPRWVHLARSQSPKVPR